MNAVHAAFWPFAALISQVVVFDLYCQVILRDGLAYRKLRGYQQRRRRHRGWLAEMCCWTHAERDARDRAQGIDVTKLLAEAEQFRCRCEFGSACYRRATDEDMRCDWCRQIEQIDQPTVIITERYRAAHFGHQRFCDTGAAALNRERRVNRGDNIA